MIECELIARNYEIGLLMVSTALYFYFFNNEISETLLKWFGKKQN